MLSVPPPFLGNESLGLSRLDDGQPMRIEHQINLYILRDEQDPSRHVLLLEDMPQGRYQLTLFPLGWRGVVEVPLGGVREVSFEVQRPAPLPARVASRSPDTMSTRASR